jgi:hypothetical protein
MISSEGKDTAHTEKTWGALVAFQRIIEHSILRLNDNKTWRYPSVGNCAALAHFLGCLQEVLTRHFSEWGEIEYGKQDALALSTVGGV